VITLFQHERAALEGRPVVLVQAMLRAAVGKGRPDGLPCV
jgi:hypothetical protein